MRLGPLRHMVTIQQLVAGSPQQNAGGEMDETWTDVATVNASIEPLRGRELIAAQATNSEVTGTIRMRYRSGVTPKMRCVFESTRYYDILAVVDTMERHREMLLSVREGPNNG
jgi:SPP1 family predicted phage head-tail adaptor